KNGDEFMREYDERAGRAPRDIVARAIASEMKKSGDEFVILDVTHRMKADILAHFPNISAKCLSLRIDLSRVPVPVTTAAHYLCGGIMVDEDGRSSIRNLYACGECASTGLHGANRLASNSLLEATVFAHRIYEDAVSSIGAVVLPTQIPDWDDSN